MEFRARDVQFSHLRVEDLDALLVFVAVETALHGQSGLGLRIGDQFDDHPMGEERLAAPILRDEGKQPMLYPVPFAGPRREVGDSYGQPGLVGERLQLALPQADTASVAAAAIGGDE